MALKDILARATEIKDNIKEKAQETNDQITAYAEATGQTKGEVVKEIGKGVAQQAKAAIKARFGR